MLTSEVCTVRFEGDGVATEFAIPFKYALNQDLTAQIKVLQYDGTNITELVENVDYTMAGNGLMTTGKIVFATAPAAGIKLAALRNVPLLQLTDWVNGEEIDLEDMELEFDRLVMALQQMQERADRGTITSIFSEETPNEVIDQAREFAENAQAAANDAVGAAQTAQDASGTAVAAAEHAVAVVDGKQDIIEDLDDIRSGAAAGATAAQPGDIGNATLTIQKNGASAGTFTANAKENTTINITVPTQASDINAMPNSTKYAASLSLSINTSTYVMTAQLKDQDGNNIGSSQTIDLPLESTVVSGSYDSQNKKLVLTLQSGSTIDIPISDLISGLQAEITSSNKLSADLVDDTSTTNKFVTASDKTAWSGKQDALSAGTGISISSNTVSVTSPTLTNTAIGTNSLAILGTINSAGSATAVGIGSEAGANGTSLGRSAYAGNGGLALGTLSKASGSWATAIGNGNQSSNSATATGADAIAIGHDAHATAASAIQIGEGTNSTASTVQIGTYTILDLSDGYIPDARISSNIARAADIPTDTGDLTNGAGYITGISSGDVTTALGYTPTDPSDLATVATSGSYNDLSNTPTIPVDTGDLTNNAGFITGISSGDVTTALGYTPANSGSLATVATSGLYSDLSGTPTIPTVNNATITITQGGVTKGSFTVNQSSAATIALDSGGSGTISYNAATETLTWS